jgi:signal transduction histidine kinase
MRDTRHRGRAAPPPEALLALDREYAEILALLDRTAAVQRMVTNVPHLAGVDVAFVGEPAGEDRIVLRHTVNITTTDLVEGLVVPAGTGLGGKVLTARRPLWVSDYCAARDITHHFKTQAAAEGVKAMIAVPIVHDGQLLGVLYGANRYVTSFGDRTAQALEHVASRTAAAQIVAERARHAAEVAVHEERRRLALQLHDTVGATLFTLGAGIRRLGAEPGLDPDVRTRVSAMEQQAVEAAAALRGSLRVLSATPEQVALGVALREHCRAFQDRSGITTRMIVLTELPTLPASRISALADAAREALLNAEKHAEARSVVVSVFAMRDGLAVSVSDDGVGLADDYLGRAGLGLTSITDRLARLGGGMTIGRNEDGGVTIQAWVPT